MMTHHNKAHKMSADPKVRKVPKFHYSMMSQLKQQYRHSEVGKSVWNWHH